RLPPAWEHHHESVTQSLSFSVSPEVRKFDCLLDEVCHYPRIQVRMFPFGISLKQRGPKGVIQHPLETLLKIAPIGDEFWIDRRREKFAARAFTAAPRKNNQVARAIRSEPLTSTRRVATAWTPPSSWLYSACSKFADSGARPPLSHTPMTTYER